MSNRRMSWSVLWWVLGVLPVGIAACTIPTVLSHPVYFDHATPWDAFWTVAGMLLLVYLALLMGALVWFFLVFPLAHHARTLVAKARGDEENATLSVGAFIQLALAAIILFGAIGLDGLLPGRAAAGQLLVALLGSPGSYQVAWHAGLWIVRGVVLVLVACAACAASTSDITVPSASGSSRPSTAANVGASSSMLRRPRSTPAARLTVQDGPARVTPVRR